MQENKQEKSPIKQNISLYLAKKGVSDYEFYKESGTTRGILKQPNGISEDNIARFLAYAPDVNISWLLTGEGDMLKNDRGDVASVQEQPKQENKQENSSPLGDIVTKDTAGAIPLVSEKAVGGFANEHFKIKERDVLAYYVVPSFRFLGVDFMIEVTGDSMVPRLCPGDIIACSTIRNSKFIQWNKCHLVATEEQGLIVKRLMPGEHEGELQAISDNKDYPPFAIPTDEITGIARVVGVIHLE